VEVDAGAELELEVLVDDTQVVVALVELVEIMVEVVLTVKDEDVDVVGFVGDVRSHRGGRRWLSYLATPCVFVSLAPNANRSCDSPITSSTQKENRPPEVM
jgi:hypothetical protein